jgi:hypothetical protein
MHHSIVPCDEGRSNGSAAERLSLFYDDVANSTNFAGVTKMTSLKLYLLLGLVFLMAGITQLGSRVGESFAWGGIFALVLGLMQPYVSLPPKLKLASALLYILGTISIATQNSIAIKVGGAAGMLIFAAHFVGVLRSPGKSRILK